MFRSVPKHFDVPALEREVMRFWEENGVRQRYLDRNSVAEERFSFLDGPITANDRMGVHHAWGRTYKDLWQRYNTMLGKRQRYQNGFDCQGLWVEVTVERELGFNSKRDIERYGIAEFVRKCKEDVFKFARIITEQSLRLGEWMDWENSYYTLSDENNYTIWHFLQRCHERGLIYRGHDVMPWCTRCGTGLSEHEIVTEGYQELTHTSVYVKFPLVDQPGGFLLVWTTTPWTLTSNVAVAVNPELTYLRVRQGDEELYVAQGARGALVGPYDVVGEMRGSDLLGWRYVGPFDDLPAEAGIDHRVIPWVEVSADEGTGMVHIAPGAGKEDFALGKEYGLAVVAPLDQNGVYVDGFGWLTGSNVHEVAGDIVADLGQKGLLYRSHEYTHRYPVCWRCQMQLVFRLVDEWFISMGPLRESMMDVVREMRWIPPYGLDRELDWLRNMDDWMISKKRYWGLALPFWVCANDHLTVVGGKEELFARALGGLEHLESPHRPWVDEVELRCETCGEVARRIPDVGNPWLDAGIVPFSTLRYDANPDYWREWFPPDFITESFPGQFRNWFYSLIAMSTVMADSYPCRTVLGYALVKDIHGREMHKSWGNSIPFEEAADRAGADMMRWLFASHPPETNVQFGWETLDEVKRKLLVLWNTYSFFVTYASVDGWMPGADAPDVHKRPVLDRWVLARLNEVIRDVRFGLDDYDAMGPARAIERFIDDLSTWYVRRSRRRFWKSENDADKRAAHATLYTCLTTVTALLAPFTPFLAESFYQNLVRGARDDAELSVHLTDFPAVDQSLIDEPLLRSMEEALILVTLGRAARDQAGIRVRQPLEAMYVRVPPGTRAGGSNEASDAASAEMRGNGQRAEFVSDWGEIRRLVLDELNVKRMEPAAEDQAFVAYTVRPNLPVLGPRYGRLVPAIRSALEALDPASVVATVEQGDPVDLQVDGDLVRLEPGDVMTSVRQREGFAAMSERGYLVALDTHLTPELLREGLAREVVRRVNDWRKGAGLEVDDRISVRYSATGELARAISQYRDYIAGEILARDLEPGEPTGSGFAAEAELGSEHLGVELKPAS